MPEVSVVIPTHNRWELLSTIGLRSALSQEDVEVEIVVVDDGSTDGTSERVVALADDRVRLFRSESCQGLAHARNRGIEQAEGEWIAFLDDDDAWAPAKLRTQLDTARAAGADFVYSPAVVIDEHRVPLRTMPASDPAALHDDLLARNMIPAGASNILAKASLVRHLGGFDEELFHLADWDMWIRLAEAGKPAVCDEVLVAYMFHRNNLHTFDRDSAPEFQRVMAKYGIPDSRRRASEIAGARWRAFAHRRAGRRVRAAREYLRSAVAQRSPGMLLRAAGVLLGERVMKLGSEAPPAPLVLPAWLDSYR